jgi:hypothetical protein
MRGVAEKLQFHRHIKHFRSDLHRYIDFLFDEPRHKGLWHGLNEEHLSNPGLNPSASGSASMENKYIPSKAVPTKKPVEDALPFANLKNDVDPKGDGTNYQTKIMVEIEKRSYRFIADLGATSSGGLRLCKSWTWSILCCPQTSSTARPLDMWKRCWEQFSWL